MSESGRRYDFILAGGTVIDGTNAEPFVADIAVRGDKIVEIGQLAARFPELVEDVSGLIVAPGFIDAHTHDDNALLQTPEMLPKISQGVTTVITGNCGISLAPLRHPNPPSPLDLLDPGGGSYIYSSFATYLDALRKAAPAVNCACLVGHSTLRTAVLDDLARPANQDEIERMRAMVEEALEAGAIGVSTGTFYPPAAAATPEEIIAVCQPLRERRGLYATHMRDEGDDIMVALQETFEVARALEVPLVISHHKLVGEKNFGRSLETLEQIRQAMQELEIAVDAYPYTASSTMLKQDPVLLASKVMITWCTPHPRFSGWDLDDAARELGKSRWDAVEDLRPAGAIYFMLDENDVQRIMTFPQTMIGSDGLPHDVHPHPRLWGTFPRVLGHYSRDLGLFPLRTAVWKMTGLTASRFGLKGRGVIRSGAFADLVLFDAKTVADVATFAEPMARSRGICRVYVNGEMVLNDSGEHSGKRPGCVLAHGG